MQPHLVYLNHERLHNVMMHKLKVWMSNPKSTRVKSG